MSSQLTRLRNEYVNKRDRYFMYDELQYIADSMRQNFRSLNSASRRRTNLGKTVKRTSFVNTEHISERTLYRMKKFINEEYPGIAEVRRSPIGDITIYSLGD